MEKIYDYLISGYYGFGNSGDDAVLSVILNEIKKREQGARIAVISEGAYPLFEELGAEFVRRRSIHDTLAALSRTRTLIFGGGSLLQDVTSRRSLLYYAFILKTGSLLCEKTAVFANGIGPLDRMGEKIVSEIIRAADTVSVRDPHSLSDAFRLGVHPEAVTLAADPVYLLQKNVTAYKKCKKLLSAAGVEERFFAVSLRACSGAGSAFEEVISFCGKMKEKGYFPVFLPMQESVDGEICREAAKKCKGAVVSSCDADVILSVLSLSEFAVGMRLHFLLLSLMAEKPTVALSYDIKIENTFPYAGGECVLDFAQVTATQIERALERAQKSTDCEALHSRCLEMRRLAVRDMDSLCRSSHTLVNTLYSKSV